MSEDEDFYASLKGDYQPAPQLPVKTVAIIFIIIGLTAFLSSGYCTMQVFWGGESGFIFACIMMAPAGLLIGLGLRMYKRGLNIWACIALSILALCLVALSLITIPMSGLLG